MKPEHVADFALGVRLRAYTFDRYKTKRKEGEEPAKQVKVTIAVADVGARAEGARAREAAVGGRACCSPATWSTSPPTCSIRSNSPAAPVT